MFTSLPPVSLLRTSSPTYRHVCLDPARCRGSMSAHELQRTTQHHSFVAGVHQIRDCDRIFPAGRPCHQRDDLRLRKLLHHLSECNAVANFLQTQHDFGLIKRQYPATRGLTGLTQWQKFEKQVEALNANAPSDTVYKVFWLGRHGEGYHNAAESL